MKRVAEKFKSEKQKLYEKYVYDSYGQINFDSDVLQSVLIDVLDEKLFEACKAEKAKEDAKKKK